LIVIAGALVSGEVPGLAQGGAAPPGGGRQGGATRNVQVLPKDWTPQQVQQFMRSTVAPGLGVMCGHCHVADRASDEKKEKVQARKMLQMLMAINDQHLKDVGDPTVAQKVTCYTCHRGTTKPLTAPPSGGGD
jgi:hypothetical protein